MSGSSHPELAEHVDFITVHLLPYWEGVHVEQAIDYLALRMEQLEADGFPDKRIVIGEVGWPSDGRTRGSAVASHEQSRRSSSDASSSAPGTKATSTTSWRRSISPGRRNTKARSAPTGASMTSIASPSSSSSSRSCASRNGRRLPRSRSSSPALLLGLFYVHSRTLGTRGRSLLALVAYAAATAAVWVIYDYSQKYLTFASILIGTLLIVGMLGVIALLLAEALEWAEAHWSKSRSRAHCPRAGKSAHGAEGVDPCAHVQRTAADGD